MGTATANLENDHVHILRLIEVMEKMTLKENVSVIDLETIVSLIRNFADGTHHAKEEKYLFPLMVKKGFSYQQGPVAIMMQDHEQGRKFVKGVADTIPLYQSGNKDALLFIHENMKGYVELLRSHISKENNVLFRMADNILTFEEQNALKEDFTKIDKASSDIRERPDFIDQIDALVKKYS